MRVTLLTNSISRNGGGISHVVRRVAQCVNELDVSVRVMALRDEFSDEDLPDWIPLVPDLYPARTAGKFGYSPELSKAVMQFGGKDAVVHLHGIWTYLSVVCDRWHRQTRQPTVISPHGMLDPWALSLSKWKKRLVALVYERRNLALSSCLHATSESELESIRAYGLKVPIALIPNGVDLPSDDECPSPKPPGDHRKVLLFLGRIHPKKGLPNLVRAWKTLGKATDDWSLVIAGPDEVGHVAEVGQLIREQGLQDSIRFAGPQYGDGKHAWLQHSDAFILPSYSEGFSVAVLEAMAYSLPVIITPQCNFPTAIQHGVAMSVEPRVESVAQGLRNLFEMHDNERLALGAKGRAFVQERYTLASVARQIVDVYRWTLGGGPAPNSVQLI